MGKKVEGLIADIATSIVEEKGLELVDVEYKKEGPDWILRVFIDKEAGVTLEDCQNVSRRLSEELDANDPFENPYLLEVSSPGIDRPLKTERDFKRFIGRLIDVSTYVPVNGEKKLTGSLLGLEEGNIIIEIEGEEIFISLDKVSQTRLAIEF